MRVTATLLLWGMCCLGAQASSITYKTQAGATDPAGEPLDAAVTFTTGAGMVTIQLSNLQANPKSDGQSLSDLLFTISNGTVSGASFGISSASAITIDHLGVPSAPTPLNTAGQIGWALGEVGSTEFTLDVLGHGPPGPAHTIIGPPSGSGIYSDANKSIAGSGPHNPFISQLATWTISDPSITSSTKVIADTFSFGTLDMGVERTGVPATPTPEVASLFLLGTGVLLLGKVLRQKRQHDNGYSQARS